MSEISDFLDECAALDALVADLPDEDWSRDTPAKGWTVAHQVAHLAWTDEVAHLSATDPEGFQAVVQEAIADPFGYVDVKAAEGATLPPAELLARWRESRTRLGEALESLDPGAKIAWFGPPMKPHSMATARLMETWAHGQDVADALGIERTPSDRLRGVCHLGVRTRDFAYIINNRELPTEQFRIELDAPDGSTWEWGPQDASERVTGPATDFALVVTQRRDTADTALRATPVAADWLTFAQAFAGAPRSMRP